MKQTLDFVLEQLQGIWRFRWVAIAVAWAICALGWAVTLFIPDRYQASARVFVDTQTTLGAATRDLTLDADIDSQIQRVRQALLGGPQLAKVADEAQLTARAATAKERQDIVEHLRTEIEISGGIGQGASGAGVYVIEYSHRDRETALRVVDLLTKSFMEGTLYGKREGSEQAQKFLVAQIADYETRLRQAEERLAAFKKEHVGLMPGTQGDYFTRLQGEIDALNKAKSDLGVATRRHDELQRQLRGEQPLIPMGGQSSGAVPSAPAGAGGDTAARIRESQQKLDELLLRFTEKHPDVIALRATIKELEQRQATEIEAARKGDTGAAARIGLSASPVFQNLQLQYNQVGVELAALRADISDRESRIAQLRSLINTAPEVEAEFSRLDRDYGVTKTQYQALVERLGRARLGEQAAQTGVFNFDVIDPPRAGFRPTSPKRPLLALGVLFFGLAAGVAVAFLLNMLKPVFSRSRQLADITGLPVLGVVSMTWLERYDAQARRHAFLLSGATAALIALGAVFLLVQHSLTRFVQGLIA
jgi:polysaccharide chain length determinant protein (PEP-CTERM system associated)